MLQFTTHEQIGLVQFGDNPLGVVTSSIGSQECAAEIFSGDTCLQKVLQNHKFECITDVCGLIFRGKFEILEILEILEIQKRPCSTVDPCQSLHGSLPPPHSLILNAGTICLPFFFEHNFFQLSFRARGMKPSYCEPVITLIPIEGSKQDVEIPINPLAQLCTDKRRTKHVRNEGLAPGLIRSKSVNKNQRPTKFVVI